MSAYIPHLPHPKQQAFLLLDSIEAFFGGAAGGGKSDALLMAALQYVDVPVYSALLLRRTFADLSQEGALIPRSHEWLAQTDAVWNEQGHKWSFPSGATVSFGYMDHEKDKYRYQSTEYQFVGFDELTQFSETQYRYMFSRLRRLAGVNIPVRMRSASNPGGTGHDWVKRRMVDGGSKARPFIRSKLADNPSLDQDTYLMTMTNLDPYTRQQLIDGDWDVRPKGGRFDRDWFSVVDVLPRGAIFDHVRYWDLAATKEQEGRDPDYTTSALSARGQGNSIYVLDMDRFRSEAEVVERRIHYAAESDGMETRVFIEQEPGASGKSLISHYVRNVIPGYALTGRRVTGPKHVRANPVASQAKIGNIHLLNGPWVDEFLDEISVFPLGQHDDMVDAFVGSVLELLMDINLETPETEDAKSMWDADDVLDTKLDPELEGVGASMWR